MEPLRLLFYSTSEKRGTPVNNFTQIDPNAPLPIELPLAAPCAVCADVLRSRQEREQGVCVACADRPLLLVVTPQGRDLCNARRAA